MPRPVRIACRPGFEVVAAAVSEFRLGLRRSARAGSCRLRPGPRFAAGFHSAIWMASRSRARAGFDFFEGRAPVISPVSWEKYPIIISEHRPRIDAFFALTMRKTVVLPAPLGPTRIFSPGRT